MIYPPFFTNKPKKKTLEVKKTLVAKVNINIRPHRHVFLTHLWLALTWSLSAICWRVRREPSSSLEQPVRKFIKTNHFLTKGFNQLDKDLYTAILLKTERDLKTARWSLLVKFNIILRILRIPWDFWKIYTLVFRFH